MSAHEAIMVRIYLSEADHTLNDLLSYLHEQARVKGVTVFRAIAGYGQSGKLHSTRLLDLSLDLPLVVEFFDQPDRIQVVLPELSSRVRPEHIVTWKVDIPA